MNLTSGSPDRARAVQQWADRHGVDYLDGGVMGDPPDVGFGDLVFTYGGTPAAFGTYESILGELGIPTYYGADAGLASVEFMAQVAVGYELLIGFLHTLHLVQAEGVDPAEFAERIADSLRAWPDLLTAIGRAVREADYPPDPGPLSVQAALMDDLIDHRGKHGVDVTRMREVKTLMDRRVEDGYGDQGFSSLIELIRNR